MFFLVLAYQNHGNYYEGGGGAGGLKLLYNLFLVNEIDTY